MKILFLHGWHSVPGGVKPTYLKDHGHEVINPKLPDEDFEEAVRIAQAEFDKHQPQIVVGSSRGGAVAMNINSGDARLVLLCPAWKKWGTENRTKGDTLILHSKADKIVPFADSEALREKSGLPPTALFEIGSDHRLADEESLAALLGGCKSITRFDGPQRNALLSALRKRFGSISLEWDEKWRLKSKVGDGRPDVTKHEIDPNENIANAIKREMGRFVTSKGWQLSFQKNESDVEELYLAPMIPVTLDVGFHATRRASLKSIELDGLRPSIPERQTTDDRLDCEGNIYVCKDLGAPADAGVQGTKSAHWWRHELSSKNRFNDPDWVILEVRLCEVRGARLYKDIWSESGIIVDNVESIPWEQISIVYPDGAG